MYNKMETYLRKDCFMSDMKKEIRNGGNVTHLLGVELSDQLNAEEETQIREAIFNQIGNVGVCKTVEGVEMVITWRASNATCTHYHCDVGGMFGDMAVTIHTKIVQKDLLVTLNDQFNNIFSTRHMGISLLLTKPLMLYNMRL